MGRLLQSGRIALLAQLVEHLHGKEGVDGSSPSEGFRKFLLSAFFQPHYVADSRLQRRPGKLSENARAARGSPAGVC